uniref:Transmembrane protein n=1 Tax=Hordeum vulgare subsp. vulgare TaxID=112509 RepID=A0A8I7B4L0_HORVV
MVLVSTPVGPRPVYDSDVEVCEPEIPTHLEMLLEKLSWVEKENKYFKKKLKIIEDKNMEMELHVAEVIDDRKMKIDAMRLKMDAMRLKMDEMHLKIRNIRKYAIDKDAWYHYAVGSIVTLLAILIAFVVAFKCFT